MDKETKQENSEICKDRYSKMAAEPRRIRNPKSKQDFFRNLPLEIMTDILSRLGIQTIMRCKCVCTSWLRLFESVEFCKSHASVSRSVPGLDQDEGSRLAVALYPGKRSSEPYKVVEVVETQNSAEKFFNFNLPRKRLLRLHSSVNGLLFLLNGFMKEFFICNPITRELIELPPPPSLPKEDNFSSVDVDDGHIEIHQENTFGFGVSKLTGKFKVVRMFQNCVEDTRLSDDAVDSLVWDACECEVYTLGTGSWRSVYVATGGGDDPFEYNEHNLGLFLNGNLHWLVATKEEDLAKISCFDLETECFSTFSAPYFNICSERSMRVLGDSLCLCDNSDRKVVIWVMKVYGDYKSWTKEFVVNHDSYLVDRYKFPLTVVPVKIFKDGDILFARNLRPKLYLYSSKTGRVGELCLTKSFAKWGFQPTIYTPTLLPLKTFAMENVTSF